MSSKLIPFLGVAFLLCLTAACAQATPSPTFTPLPTSTPTTTPTVVWFPPTETPTPHPTVEPSPTLDLLPGVEAVLLRDDFSTGEGWSLASSDQGSVAVRGNHLTLALAQPRGYLFTTRQEPLLSNFYAEITASPSLCTGADEYGLLVRVSSSLDYYRISLSCDGRARVDRLYQGVATTAVSWTTSGAIPSTVPNTSRLQVWALGSEIRFFIDDFLLFSLQDTVLYTGTLGVFVRAAGDTGVTVSFSDLVIYTVEN